jgi:ABC-type ATPase with predicted acetyltransferase domain
MKLVLRKDLRDIDANYASLCLEAKENRQTIGELNCWIINPLEIRINEFDWFFRADAGSSSCSDFSLILMHILSKRSLAKVQKSSICFITAFKINSDYRNKGIGTYMIKSLSNIISKRTPLKPNIYAVHSHPLEPFVDTNRLNSFYKSQEFKELYVKDDQSMFLIKSGVSLKFNREIDNFDEMKKTQITRLWKENKGYFA